MFRRELAAVEFAAVHPFGEFGHGPVVEDRSARILAAEALGAVGRLADFLAVVEHHGTAREAEEDCRNRAADIRAEVRPMPFAGEADFVMVFRVAEGIVEDELAHGLAVDVVRPASAIVDFLEHVVGGVVVNGVEARGEEVEHDVAAADLRDERVAAGDFRGIGVVGLGGEKDFRVPLAGAGDHPMPELRRDHVRHVHAEAIDAHRLPMRDNLVHFFPGVRDRFAGLVAVRVFAGFLRGVCEIEAVVELHGLIPIPLRGAPGCDIVAGHAAVLEFRFEKAVAFRAGDLACGAGDVALFVNRGEAQGRAVFGFGEPEKVVLRAEEFRAVVGGAEGEVGAHGGAVAARDMVRDEVDEDFQAGIVDAGDGGLEFLEALRGVRGVVGRDIEIVADRIGASRKALQEVGVVGRLADIGVVGGCGLLMDAGEPDVRGAEFFDFGDGGFVEVVEFPDAVFLEEAVWFAGFVGVAEEAGEHLVDADFREVLVRARVHGEAGGLARAIDCEVAAERDLAGAQRRVGVDATGEKAPTAIGLDVLRPSEEVEF